MPRQHINDLELHDELTGDGDDTLVLVHGCWTDHLSWQFVVPPLAERPGSESEPPGRLSIVGGDRPHGRWQSKRGMWSQVRNLPSRFSDWMVTHPVLWGVGSGVVLVLLGFALDLAPIVVIAAGAAIGVLNILHARRRGYCPLRVEPGSHPGRAEVDQPFRECSDD